MIQKKGSKSKQIDIAMTWILPLSSPTGLRHRGLRHSLFRHRGAASHERRVTAGSPEGARSLPPRQAKGRLSAMKVVAGGAAS